MKLLRFHSWICIQQLPAQNVGTQSKNGCRRTRVSSSMIVKAAANCSSPSKVIVVCTVRTAIPRVHLFRRGTAAARSSDRVSACGRKPLFDSGAFWRSGWLLSLVAEV